MRVSISIPQEYKDVFMFLQQQSNKSEYICEVLAKELRGSEERKVQILDQKLDTILSYLQSFESFSELTNISKQVIQSEKKQTLKKEDIELLQNLF